MDAPRLEVLTSADITAPISAWTPQPDVFAYADGGLHVEIALTGNDAHFLRVHDKEAVSP